MHTITLGDLIDKLERIALSCDADCWVCYDFCNAIPTTGGSWRGDYSNLAIGWTTDWEWDKRPLLKDFVKHLRENCYNKTFEGYRGGNYKMTGNTPVWVDKYGEATSTAITGVSSIRGSSGEVYRVILNTAFAG